MSADCQTVLNEQKQNRSREWTNVAEDGEDGLGGLVESEGCADHGGALVLVDGGQEVAVELVEWDLPDTRVRARGAPLASAVPGDLEKRSQM